MLKTVRIKNFRGFKDFEINNLNRVNLIAGKNNSGKTALLEALFLHLGPNNPALSLIINQTRNYQQIQFDPENLWGWLFYDKQTSNTIELLAENEQRQQQVLRIKLAVPQSSATQLSREEKNATGQTLEPPTDSITTASLKELVLDYQDPKGEISTVQAQVSVDGNLTQRGMRSTVFPFAIFIAATHRFNVNDVDRFSRLDQVNRLNEVVDILRILEPRLKRLSVSFVGGIPSIHGDLGLSHLVPLPLMGEGICRLLSIIAAILEAKNGFVLVDEIETGLHYSVMKPVWSAIGDAARRMQAQIFATTHSRECIGAAHEAFSYSDIYDLQLTRLERINNNVMAVALDQQKLRTALELDWEVR